LLIRRARRRGDPWSGDMAFPGGLVGRADADTRAGVLRETREEIGLDLARHGALLGELPRQLAFSPRPPWGPMAIVPYVFAIEGAPVLAPDRREAEEARRFATSRSRDTARSSSAACSARPAALRRVAATTAASGPHRCA
jgi:8-oxo-dGTP pyrophosphatase MutT (NUDIX family)